MKDAFDPAAHGFTAATRPHLVSANQLADVAQTDKWFMEVAENYVGSSGFSVPKLVRELVESESVPYLPVQRYKESGLRKRHDWEHVWDLQRREDKIDAEEKVDEPGITDVERLRRQAAANKRKKDRTRRHPRPAEIRAAPTSPRPATGDCAANSTCPRNAGSATPAPSARETIPSSSHGPDGITFSKPKRSPNTTSTPRTTKAGSPTRLKPLLAGLADLIPWLKQWHNIPDPNLGMGLGDYFAGFLDEQCRTLSLTVEEVNKARFGDSQPG